MGLCRVIGGLKIRRVFNSLNSKWSKILLISLALTFLLGLFSIQPATASTSEKVDSSEVISEQSQIKIISPYDDIDWSEINQYKGAFHVHTAESDGESTVEVRIQEHVKKGFDILAITDHDSTYFPKETTWPWTDWIEEKPKWTTKYNGMEQSAFYPDLGENGMLAIRGGEISYPHHIGSYFNDATYLLTKEQRALQKIGEKNGLAQFFHPARYDQDMDWYVNFFNRYNHLLGHAIFSSDDGENFREEDARGLWDNLLSHYGSDREVYAWANTDVHADGAYAVDGAWQIVLAENHSEQGAVRESIEDGEMFWVANMHEKDIGVTVENIDVSDGSIELRVSGNYEKIVWVYNHEVVAVGEEFTIENRVPGQEYVRFEILETTSDRDNLEGNNVMGSQAFYFENKLEVGASKRNITPTKTHPEDGVYLGGYGIGFRSAIASSIFGIEGNLDTTMALGDTRRAKGVRDNIWVRTIAFSDAGQTFVEVSLDVTGIGDVIIERIREEVSNQVEIPKTHILISATHTHSGPDLQGLWGGIPKSYREYVISKTVSSVKEAVNSRKPARLYKSSFKLPKYNKNRRGHGFTDNVMTVLHATDSAGNPIATLINYAAHPTVLGPGNKLVSADFPGALVSEVKEEIGGMPMYISGAIGDVSAKTNGLDVDEYGSKLGEIAVDRLKSDNEVVTGNISHFNWEYFKIPITNPMFLLAYNPLSMSEISGEDISSLLPEAAREQFESLSPTSEGFSEIVSISLGTTKPYYTFHLDPQSIFCVETRVHYIEFGNDLGLVTVPGEGLTRFGLGLKKMNEKIRRTSTPENLMILGLTNDTLGYLVPQDEWQAGEPLDTGYEESMTVGGKKTATYVRNNLKSINPKFCVAEFDVNIQDIDAGESPEILIENAEGEYGNYLKGEHNVNIVLVKNGKEINYDENLHFTEGLTTFTGEEISTTGDWTATITIDKTDESDDFKVS